MLGRTDVYQVTGDGTAGLFRATAPAETNRTVEAYSWGGLTAGSKTRAMWVLLLPFALVNLAGWMVEPIPAPREEGQPLLVRPVIWLARSLEKLQRALVHLTALAVTGAYIMWVALGSMNLLAYQCGARDECAEGRFYAEFFRDPFFVDHPGRRIVVGALVPLVLLALFAVISLVSRARYESFTDARRSLTEEGAPEILTTQMSQRTFWHTNKWHTRLFRIHIAVALAFLSGLTAYATGRFTALAPGAIAPPSYVAPWSTAVFRFTVALAVAAVAIIVASVIVERSTSKRTLTVLDVLTTALLWTSIGLTAVSLTATWQLRGDDDVLVRNSISSDLWGFGWAPILLFAAAVGFVLLFSLVEVAKWTVTCQVEPELFFIAIAGVLILAWPYAPIVLVIALIIAVLARYVEVQLCCDPSEFHRWLIVAAATIIMVAVQWFGSDPLEGTVWGDEWPRLTPVILSSFAFAFFFFRYTGRDENAPQDPGGAPIPFRLLQRIFPVLAVGGLVAVGVVLWRVLGRLDPIYLALHVGWLLTSFFWVAIQPHSGFRWNGPGAVALYGTALTAGLFSGGLIRFESLLSRDEYTLRFIELYDWIAVGFVSISAAAIVALLLWLLFTRSTHGRNARERFLAKRQELLSAGRTVAPAKVAGKARNWVTLSRGVEAIDVFIMHISMATLFATMALVLHFYREGVPFTKMLDVPVGSSWDSLISAAAWVTLMIVLGTVLAVRSGLRDAGFRRQIGIIWDVTSFWPRHFHPFAPPSYAVRTVPELQERIAEVTATNAGAVILSGHSQGSVVAFAAAASLDETATANLVLVTHGSPLRRFYARFFPSYFTDELLIETAGRLGRSPSPTDGSWLNFHRQTDPVTLPIFRPLRRVGRFPYSPEPMTGLATTLGTTSSAELPDVELRDPMSVEWAEHRRPPDVLWHLSYMADPRMADAVDTLTEILSTQLAAPAQPRPADAEQLEAGGADDDQPASDSQN
jgi:hypothetical protein